MLTQFRFYRENPNVALIKACKADNLNHCKMLIGAFALVLAISNRPGCVCACVQRTSRLMRTPCARRATTACIGVSLDPQQCDGHRMLTTVRVCSWLAHAA